MSTSKAKTKLIAQVYKALGENHDPGVCDACMKELECFEDRIQSMDLDAKMVTPKKFLLKGSIDAKKALPHAQAGNLKKVSEFCHHRKGLKAARIAKRMK